MPFQLKSQALFLALCACFLACTGSDNKNTSAKGLFEEVPADQTGIRFVNQVENSEDFNIFSYRNFYNGGGVAIGDLNADGLADVFMTSNMGDNKLYLNKGNFQFEDVTEKAGLAGNKFWSTGVVLTDLNADGHLDIYVCNAGFKKGETHHNQLFINDGNKDIPHFSDQAAAWNLDEEGYATHAAFFDYDLDGDLDCYLLNNSFMPVNTLNYSNNRELYAQDWPVADFLKGGGDKLLRNDGPPANGKGGFTDVTKDAGIYGSLIGFGLGITVGDVNGDHWPDLYVSNDFYERDYLYINQKNGTFKEEIEQWMEHLSEASMGADMADINNDGYPEIFTTEMLPGDENRLKTTTQFENYNIYELKEQRGFYYQFSQNCLQLNNKNRSFSEIARFAGVSASDWSWGALMFDADNDGFRDIYICNGIYKDVIDQDFIDFFADEVVQKMALTGKKEQMNEVISKMPSTPLRNKAYRNRGDLRFDDSGDQWGFTTPSFSNGAAYGDLDNDGDLDLVVNNVNQQAFVYRNTTAQTQGNHYLALQLNGKDANTFAVGAKVTLYRGQEQLNTELIPTRGFQSSVEYKLTFGLGKQPAIDSLEVIWPDHTRSLLLRPAADTLLRLNWPAGKPVVFSEPYSAGKEGNQYVQITPSPFPAMPEDNFADFYNDPLIMRKTSREGPRACTGDVNGDGLEDLFIGGPAGVAARLYLQTASGGFQPTDKATFEADADYEDTAVRFFDADGDKDLDLMVGGGGNHQPAGSRWMQNRLYLNNGKGHFTLENNAFPLSGFNTAFALPFDLDNDGDQDLLVGSRSVPGDYGVPPRHFLYQNDGKGHFKDIAKTAAPDLPRLGMLTDAVLADISGDKTPEIITVGEWRNPKAFEIKNGQLVPLNTSLDNYSGWFYAIQAADLDGDGDQDLVLGNRGENFYFSADAEHPAKLWVGDYDGNGDIDKIATRNVQGKDMPLAMKKELTSQIPSLKKKNLKHADYSGKAIQDLFAPEMLQKGVAMACNYFPSAVALNQGNGQFNLVALPREVQFSSVHAILCHDLNADGRPDLLLAGNDSGFMPQFSRLDASFGHVLINAGNGQFNWVENRNSGYFVRGEARSIVLLPGKGKTQVLTTLNNRAPVLCTLKNAGRPVQ